MPPARSAGLYFVSALALACGGAKSGPSAPSVFGSFVASFSVSTANPGQSVGFTVTLPTGIPAGSLLFVQITFNERSGAIDTITVPQNYGNLDGALTVPDGFPDGTLTLVATLPAQSDTAKATLTIQDTEAPTIQYPAINATAVPFSVIMAPGAPMLLVGSTDTVSFSAADNGSLAVVGFTLGSPANIADSIVASGLSAFVNVPIQIPTAWLGSTPTFSVFAGDRDNNEANQTVGKVAVAAHLARPVRTVALDTSVRDAVYDAKRQVVYLAVGDQPAIEVLSPATMTYGTPIPIPVPAADVDVRPGGDSLVVALAHTGDLAIINLAGGPGPATVVHLNSLNTTPGDTTSVIDSMLQVRVAGDGRIIVGVGGVQYAGDGPTTGAAQLDPSTGHDSVLALSLPGQSVLTRSGDGTRVLVGNALLMYNTTVHGYGVPSKAQATQLVAGTSSADKTGATFAIADQLYDSTLQNLGVADISAGMVLFPPSLISQAGTEFFVGVSNLPYYIRFQVPIKLNPTLSDLIGVPLDVVDAPETIQRFVGLADTTSLLALGADQAMLFDLTQSSLSTRRVPVGRVARQAAAHRATKPIPGGTLPVLRLQLGHFEFNVTFPVEPGDNQANREAHGRN